MSFANSHTSLFCLKWKDIVAGMLYAEGAAHNLLPLHASGRTMMPKHVVQHNLAAM